MVCKQEPKGQKPFLPGLIKLQVLYQGAVPEVVTAANILHAKWDDNTNHPILDLLQWVNFAHTQWGAYFTPHLATGWSVIGMTVQSLGGDGLQGVNNTAIAGSAGTLPLAPQSAVCVSWGSGIVQRGGRARTYLPGVPDSATTQIGSPRLTSAFATALKNDALSFNNAMSSYSVNGHFAVLGVPSYYSKCQIRPVPVFYPFVSTAVHERLDSQRRRSGKERLYPIV